MSNQPYDKDIIFLISQPRAGSTLTQKIFGVHPEIFTASEPWVLLHPFTSLHQGTHSSIYDARFAQIGLRSFLEELPGGVQDYYKSLAETYSYLYHRISKAKGKKFFLDKTPRYYQIIPELAESFPKAHFVILIRNPLAVFCSIITTWIKGKWLRTYLYRHDLLMAPKLLLEGINLLRDRAILLHYEQLLANPSQNLHRVCQSLGLSFTPDMLNYGDHKQGEQWQLGDRKQVYKQRSLNPKTADSWITKIKHPQCWRFLNDYLEMLGADTINSLGYDYDTLKDTLSKNRPAPLSFWNTLPLDLALKDPNDFPSFDYGYLPVKFIDFLQRKLSF